MAQRTWLITGVSSGFGYEMTKQLLEKGAIVIGTVRNTSKVKEFIVRFDNFAFDEVINMPLAEGQPLTWGLLRWK